MPEATPSPQFGLCARCGKQTQAIPILDTAGAHSPSGIFACDTCWADVHRTFEGRWVPPVVALAVLTRGKAPEWRDIPADRRGALIRSVGLVSHLMIATEWLSDPHSQRGNEAKDFVDKTYAAAFGHDVAHLFRMTTIDLVAVCASGAVTSDEALNTLRAGWPDRCPSAAAFGPAVDAWNGKGPYKKWMVLRELVGLPDDYPPETLHRLWKRHGAAGKRVTASVFEP